MQVIVFTEKTGELVLHSGPYTLDTNYIVKLEGITGVWADNGYYKAEDADGNIKLIVPIVRTNVIFL